MYRAADGGIMLVVGNKAQWERLAAVVCRPDLPADPRFATNADRIAHREPLNAILEPIFLARPRQHWIDAFAAAGIPCGPVNELHEVFADPQVQARQMLVHLPHPARAAMPMLANPIRLSDTPVQYRLRPPDLGQHTDEVLAELPGYDAARRRALREAGVI
jgi:crotonobetainyl-CoA:carnitine CoA-transferase CaiB-like acyl-CoA transferase